MLSQPRPGGAGQPPPSLALGQCQPRRGQTHTVRCDLCDSDGDITGFDEMILEAEKLSIKRKSATDAVRSRDPDGSLNYSLEECRQEINCYKRMYSLGKIQKILMGHLVGGK